MESTQAMRDRIRELMSREQDDYDRAVECVLDDLEGMLVGAQGSQGQLWSASKHDEIIKRLMTDIGHPNSQSIYGAFKQFANELHALSLSSTQGRSPADEIIGQIEQRFPDWRGFRDLVDCIDVTLHRLRGGR